MATSMTPERWKRIEAAFESVIDLDAEARAGYLNAHFAEDEELRHEVQKLISSSESAGEFIESPIWADSRFLNTSAKKEISDSLESQADPDDRSNFLGKQVGVYRLTREIGRGGMGAVYLAERSDGEFEQRVAIKLIKRGMDSDFIVRRFRHERQILASLEHPFIARLLDGGTVDDVPYFVMEYIEGESLYDYCDNKRLGLRSRLKLFQKVCSAIEYAHSKQIVHRDIKPSNILIDRLGSPKLLDFGIAKILDPNLIHESVNPTASMLRMMTPDYASPEQVQGLDVTPSSDIYSLGVLLYELLTGHRPYNFSGRALHEITQVICEQMPESPSLVLGRNERLLPRYASSDSDHLEPRCTTEKELRNELSNGLDSVVIKALNKAPAKRYFSVSEFSKDISRYMRGVPVEAPKVSSRPRTRPERFLRAPENSKSLAVLPFKFLNLGQVEDSDENFLGLGLADALITRLSKVRKFVVRPTSSILSFAGEQTDPISAGNELNVEFILEGSIKKAKNRLRVTVQLLNVAENAAIWATSIDEILSDVFTLEDSLANRVVEVLLPQLTGTELQEFANRGTQDPEAFEHYLRGRYHFNSLTEEGLAKAFVCFHQAIAADPGYSHAYSGIADYYNWLGMLGVLAPQECYVPAIEAATKAVELDPELSEANASLGLSLHAGDRDWSKAEHHLQRAIELNPGNANAYVWYSIVLYTEGRFEEGLEIARRGLDLDPLTPFNHHNIAWGLYYARRYDEAAARYEQIIADYPNYSFGYYGLSKVLRLTGETRRAIELNKKVRELMGDSVFSLLSEAECYAADGQADAARERLDILAKLSLDRYVSPYQLSLAYSFLGDLEKVIACLNNALEIKEAWLNWIGVDPALDLVRGDPRFEAILDSTGFRMAHKSHSAGGTGLSERHPGVHDLTTILIADGDLTDDTTLRLVKPKRHVFTTVAVALLAVFSIATLFFVFYQWPSTPAAREAIFEKPSLVILPFKGSNDRTNSLGTGLADALTNRLGNIKNIEVMSAATGRSAAGIAPQNIAAGFDVAFVLRGNISEEPNGMVLNAEFVNARDSKVVWSKAFASSGGDLFGLQRKLAENVWTSLGIEPLPLELQQVEKGSTVNNVAYEYYLLGRFQMTNRSAQGISNAIGEFENAITNDADFAPAYVGLADAYSLLNLYSLNPPPDSYKKALANVQKALEIDADLAEAHASIAYIRFYHERNRSGSELDFRRAIQLNPSYSQAHHWFALVLAAMDRPVEAVQEAKIAERLDPASAAVRSALGMVHFLNGDFDEAITECDRSLELNPDFLPAIRVKRWTYTAMGDRKMANEIFAKELKAAGGSLNDAGWKITEIELSEPADRYRLSKELTAAANDVSVRKNDFGFAYEIALAWSNIGNNEKVLEYLHRAEAAGAHNINFISVDPRLAKVRNQPDFQALKKLFEE